MLTTDGAGDGYESTRWPTGAIGAEQTGAGAGAEQAGAGAPQTGPGAPYDGAAATAAARMTMAKIIDCMMIDLEFCWLVLVSCFCCELRKLNDTD